MPVRRQISLRTTLPLYHSLHEHDRQCRKKQHYTSQGRANQKAEDKR